MPHLFFDCRVNPKAEIDQRCIYALGAGNRVQGIRWVRVSLRKRLKSTRIREDIEALLDSLAHQCF